jgi:hypothetical protein
MNGFAWVRATYRCADRVVLRHLPSPIELRIRATGLWFARRMFGSRIHARSAEELAANSRSRYSTGRMPRWAEREIHELARFEPELHALTGRDARVGEYFIPWNMVHLGRAYAQARRQLGPTYASMVLTGSAGCSDADAWLRTAPRPAVVVNVDLDAEPALRALSAAHAVDYLSLPGEGINADERAALFTRLVLQLRPAQLRYARHDFIELCLQRHGLAMAAVSDLGALPGDERPAGTANTDPAPAHGPVS